MSDAAELEAYVEENRERFLDELFEYLEIPSISTDESMKEEVGRCAGWLRDHLSDIGFKSAEIHQTDGHPIVYAEHCEQPDKPTILIYAHYDVQPPDPLDKWDSEPFKPEVRDGKIFARGATDDKGQFFSHVKGLEAHLATSGELPVNVKLLVEGEEEVGSVHLEDWVSKNRQKLACDGVVISDSAMFAEGLPTITYGLRGLSYFEVTLRGPDHDLHSGLYGGAVPNPINELAKIISKLHDDDGRVAIPGFYDDVEPPTDEEREQFASLPFDEEDFRAETGAPGLTGEEGYTTLERRWVRPTLDCNGIWGGYTEPGAKTVLPSEASAKISCRLVPNQDPDEITELASEYIEEIAPSYVDVEVEPHHGGKPVVSPRDNATVDAATRALKRAWGRDAVFTRGGGTIPVVPVFTEILESPTVLMGFGLNDDRLHSPNEKFNVENFYKGIETSTYLWDELEQA
jgi:acetylornithine deacetylase/succinyl-diaminopimelate desuccinylase-like protein